MDGKIICAVSTGWGCALYSHLIAATEIMQATSALLGVVLVVIGLIYKVRQIIKNKGEQS